MPRSDYIYVAMTMEGLCHDHLKAAFTVKHELARWLYFLPDEEFRLLYALRMQDSGFKGKGDPVLMDTRELRQQGYQQELSQWQRLLPEYRGYKPQPPVA